MCRGWSRVVVVRNTFDNVFSGGGEAEAYLFSNAIGTFSY